MELPPNLIYVSDDMPGCSRRRCGRGFAYYDAEGRLIRAEEEKARFNALAVPPAYCEVWLCPDPRGHLQATGRDARGRKQYRYHPDYRAYRENWKFDRLPDFGRALPSIRRAVDRRLSRYEAGDKRYVLALVVKLLDRTGLRVGNENYLRQNGTRGLLTLTDDHVELPDAVSRLRLEFPAKGGKEVRRTLASRTLAARVRDLQELPGQRLFRYETEDGDYRDVTSDEVNTFLYEITSEHYTAKDFRTWTGTREAANTLAGIAAGGAMERTPAWRTAVREAAKTLGNTEAMARKSYVHPALATEEAWHYFQTAGERQIEIPDRLSKIEAALLHFLES